jgi:hypothetical protein
VQANPDETMYNSIGEGLGLIDKEEKIMHINDDLLKGYLRANPFHIQRLDIFAKVASQTGSSLQNVIQRYHLILLNRRVLTRIV